MDPHIEKKSTINSIADTIKNEDFNTANGRDNQEPLKKIDLLIPRFDYLNPKRIFQDLSKQIIFEEDEGKLSNQSRNKFFNKDLNFIKIISNNNNQKNKSNLHERERLQNKNIDNNVKGIWYDEEILVSDEEERNFDGEEEDNIFTKKRNLFLKYQNKFDPIKENPMNEDNSTPSNKVIFKSRMMTWKNIEPTLSKHSPRNLKCFLEQNIQEDPNINNCTTLKSSLIKTDETLIEEKTDCSKEICREKQKKIEELNQIIEDLRRENVKLKQERFNEFNNHFKNIKPNTWSPPRKIQIKNKNEEKFINKNKDVNIFYLSNENLNNKNPLECPKINSNSKE